MSRKNITHKLGFALHSVVYSLCFLQTPVFKGEEENRLEDAKQFILRLLESETFALAVLGVGIAIGLLILYNRRKAIPELEIQVIKEDTWFATRDDNNRIGIVVSVDLRNKSTSGIYITNCKLSGYSPREDPKKIHLESSSKELSFPKYKHFYKGQEFYLGPYSSEKLWFYYESRSMTMANLIEASLSVKDSRKKRKSVRIGIPRHADQIAVYQEMAKMW